MALLVIAAWLLAANHCLVAGLMPVSSVAAASHEHCGGKKSSQPEKKNRGCDGQNCCKSLSAPAIALAKNLVAADTVSFAPNDYTGSVANPFVGEYGALVGKLDTGPPFGDSFLETVLQRSLRAHAPPLFA